MQKLDREAAVGRAVQAERKACIKALHGKKHRLFEDLKS